MEYDFQNLPDVGNGRDMAIAEHPSSPIRIIGEYFSHTRPSDLMRIMLDAMPVIHDVPTDQHIRHAEALRAFLELFEFLTRLENHIRK